MLPGLNGCALVIVDDGTTVCNILSPVFIQYSILATVDVPSDITVGTLLSLASDELVL